MKQAEAVWAVAALETATAREVAQTVYGPDAVASQASDVLHQMFEAGFLVRRSRTTDVDNSPKSSCYEYAIASPTTFIEFENVTPPSPEGEGEGEP